MSNPLKTALMLAAISALLVTIGGILSGYVGVLVALGLALVLSLGAYRFCAESALHLARARSLEPAEAPDLERLVEELAMYAQLPVPKVALIDSPSPNAFAVGRDPHHAVVVVTHGVVGLLNPDELAAVLAHELAHVRNRDILSASVAATLVGPFAGTGVLAPLVASLLRTVVPPSREFTADETGARIHGNPASLARALQKIEDALEVEPLHLPTAVGHLCIVSPLSDRPSTEARTHRLHELHAAAPRSWPVRVRNRSTTKAPLAAER